MKNTPDVVATYDIPEGTDDVMRATNLAIIRSLESTPEIDGVQYFPDAGTGEDRVGIIFKEGKMLDKDRISQIMEEAGANDIDIS
jgi:hypothetical protein